MSSVCLIEREVTPSIDGELGISTIRQLRVPTMRCVPSATHVRLGLTVLSPVACVMGAVSVTWRSNT
ncbi:hypothetical protein [Shimazuella alba]|uniref:Uncharacterized protein n=1 Tax=Shimazuella alba TaxID=2690964 RepID=A0A6I4VUJ4_9BACL|nr:hypothetical protein [Shimazuella alba]MXQ53466.1 hypothetical protein [Shimazuella alba]